MSDGSLLPVGGWFRQQDRTPFFLLTPAFGLRSLRKDENVLPSLTQGQPAVYCLTVFVGSVLPNLCLCFQTHALVASQQVQSVSARVNSDQITAQSSRCKLSVS